MISERHLKCAGFKQPIVRCNDGAVAIDYFSRIEPESAPHAILLDLNMPKVNGLEVLHWVRTVYSKRDVAVYLLTSSEDPGHMRQAVAERVTRYLLKNSSLNELIESLDYLIKISNDPSLKETEWFRLGYLSRDRPA
jgi:DNA-binding NarL/FixJ family response regulator